MPCWERPRPASRGSRSTSPHSRPPCRRLGNGGFVLARVTFLLRWRGLRAGRVRAAGKMAAVPASAPADDLAVLAELQGVLIEVLESRNADLTRTEVEQGPARSGWRGWSARCRGTRGTPGCRRRLMTCPGRPRRRPRPKRGDGKKTAGKQRGAPGAHLAWIGDPGKTEPLFPRGACGCGRDLADAEDLGVATSHQVIDTPAVTATVTAVRRATRSPAAAGGFMPRRRRPGPARPTR